MKQKLLLLFVLFTLSSVAALAYDFKVDGIYYNIINDDSSSNTVEVTYEVYHEPSYTGSVNIPETVEYQGATYTVTSIGDRAFYGCSDMTSVEFPSTITSIGMYAFYKCISLSDLTLPNSLTLIDEWAFQRCKSITTLEIPNSVTSIGDYAFSDCIQLASLEIPNSVTYLGCYAFNNCESLTSVEIHSSVIEISVAVFCECPSLRAFWGKYASEDNRCLIKDGVLVAFAPSGLSTYSIPDCVKSIGASSFYSCAELTDVTLPNTISSIGSHAFAKCVGLTFLEIPNSVTSIGLAAFYQSGLTKVNIPSSVTSINESTFKNCTNLKEVEIPSTVTSIGSYAFSKSGLTQVEIPSSVTFIWDQAFSFCEDLTTVVFNATNCKKMGSKGEEVFSRCYKLTKLIIGEGLESIPDYAFYNINQLEEVKVAWENPSGLKIGTDVFSSVNNTDLLVPLGKIDNYKDLLPWKDFKMIREYFPNGQVVKPCETPSISIDNNNLIFTCSTPRVKYYYTIECLDAKQQTDSEDGVVELSGIYQVSVSAYRDGYYNSDTVIGIIVWVNPQIENEDAGILSLEAKKAVLIKTDGDNFQICGTEYGETIQLYSMDGVMLESTKAVDGETTLSHSLQPGQIYIIRYGDKAIKYKF